MRDNRNNQNREEDKIQPTQQGNEGTKEKVGEQRPQDRLNDGTNDFKNGDQDESSENSDKESKQH
jgi:hypothetical protein